MSSRDDGNPFHKMPDTPGKIPLSNYQGDGAFNWQIGQKVFIFKSQILDLRPEMEGLQRMDTTAVPVSRSNAYGVGTTLRLLIWPQPAIVDNLTVDWWEAAIDWWNPDGKLFMIRQPEDMTDDILTGGVTGQPGEPSYIGASVLQFNPPAALRFWQVFVRFTFTGQGAPPNLFFRASGY